MSGENFVTENRTLSTFVPIVAWIFIALSGFCTIISILQNIMVLTVFRSPEVTQAMRAPPPDAPPFAAFMASHFQWFFLGFLLLSVFMLASSIGLLRRWNWARLCFIGLLSFAILWQLAGLGFQFFMFSSMHQQFSAAQVQGSPDMGPFLVAIAVVSVLFAAGFAVLFGWIIKRLVSPAVVAEFRR
jgi:hypothetical protein